MNPITIEIDDVGVTLKSLEINKIYNCKCESLQITCQLKQKLSFRSPAENLVATEALLNIRNASTEAFPIDKSHWELIDTDGYAYKAQVMCDAIRPPRTVDLDFHERVSPGTQVDLVLLFPELKSNIQIAGLSYCRHRDRELYLFEVCQSKRKATDLVQARDQLRIDTRAARIEDCRRFLEELQKVTQSRLSKTLIKMESLSLGRKHQKLARTIEQTLQRIKPLDRKPLETAFQALMAEYQSELESDKNRGEERKKANATIDELRRLHHNDFEHYVKELFEAREYEKVTLRGGSGDQGVDILAEKNGERVAIQCKCVKGLVGTDKVRDLIGAMELTESQRGFLVTTGTFSIQAQTMVRGSAIELINGTKLAELIEEAITK